jgi:hypothetical protein
MTRDLSELLTGVDWATNVSNFVADSRRTDTLQRGCHLVAVWNYELSFQDAENAALPFLQEMKASLFYVPACLSLGLYKPAASSMRASLENALYYSYFCSHASELRTLVRDDKFYISKAKIVDYHNTHTVKFRERQAAVGFSSELESWYSEISAIIHGQIPGVWTTSSLEASAFSLKTSNMAMREFSRAVSLINYLFLLTVQEEEWEGFSSAARQLFLRGMSHVKKEALGRVMV